MSVTIRDVAKTLNLSITTVSRALDGYSDVAEETRQRVVQTAQAMGYFPNWAARHLRRQRADTVGYILPAHVPRFADPFFSEFIAGLSDEVAHHQHDLLIASAPPNGETERQTYQRWVRERKVDGFILNRLRLSDWRVQYLAAQKIPFTALERSQDRATYPYVEVEVSESIQTLLAHFKSHNHRRVAYMGAPPDLVIQERRFTAFRAGLQACGLAYDPKLTIETQLTRRSGYQGAQTLLNLSEPPTAIFCVNDLTAIGALSAAQDLGFKVGKDLVIAGFDGIDEDEMTRPPLTTIQQPIYEIALHLVKMLLALTEGNAPAELFLRIKPVLILRQSTGSNNGGTSQISLEAV